MPDKYEGLRTALIAGPTPGPWKANTSNEIGPISKEDDQSFGMVLPMCFAEFENSEANRRYIAACHPAAIRALLADYDRMRNALEAIEQWEVPLIESRGAVGCAGQWGVDSSIVLPIRWGWAMPGLLMPVEYGSNGVRDYFRGIARAALAQEQGGGDD